MTRPIAGTIPTQAHDHTLKHCCHSQLSKAFEALYAFKSHAAEHLRAFVDLNLGLERSAGCENQDTEPRNKVSD